MGTPWQIDNAPIVDADGKIIECDDCPCPPSGTVPCAEWVGGVAPSTISVTIPSLTCGAGTTGCSQIASLSGTFILNFIGKDPEPLGVCYWTYTYPFIMCAGGPPGEPHPAAGVPTLVFETDGTTGTIAIAPPGGSLLAGIQWIGSPITAVAGGSCSLPLSGGVNAIGGCIVTSAANATATF